MKTFLELKGALKEAKSGNLSNPPPMIVLKRRGYRTFPNGENIALYHSDVLNLDVSIPFSNKDTRIATVVKEASTVLKTLKKISTSPQAGKVSYENGNVDNMQPSDADLILNLVNNPDLSWENKTKLAQKLRASPKDMKQVVDFIKGNKG